MANPLLLPLAVLLAFPGIPGFGKFRQKPAAPLDSLPPAWRTSSQLGLESSFVRAWLPPLGPARGMRIQQDPRTPKVTFDPDSSRVRYSVEMGNVVLGQTASIPVTEFGRDLSARNFERIWRENSLNTLGANSASAIGSSGSGQGLSFKFPSPLPRKMQSWLGPGGPALTVSGSENIRISGTSQWSNQQIGLLGQSRSLFPSLDMQQDLDIRLEGQLSDRIKVNLLQNSAVQIPLANRIAINYRGDEDDLVQSLDLGNTNLTLPGTQFVSYSGRNEGLFGAKFTTRLGPLDFTLLASKQEGRSERATYSGGTSKQTPTIRDIDYISGVYFMLYDPNLDTQAIDTRSIQLFLDPGSYLNAIGLVKGRAYLNPLAVDDTGTTARPLMVRGNFRPLQPGTDYEVLSDIYGPTYVVLRLKIPVTGDNQMLGVSYRYQQGDVSEVQPTDPYITIGGPTIFDMGGGVLDTVQVMKLLRAPLDVLPAEPAPRQDWFDLSAPMAQTLSLELRNFYNLGGSRIDPVTLDLKVRWRDGQPPVYARDVGDLSIPLLETVGLDNKDETTGSPVDGHDGRLDGRQIGTNTRSFVDYENGILFFPELRPFAPAIDSAAGPFDRAVLAFLNRRDSLNGAPNTINEPNPAVYDKRNKSGQQRALDRIFTLDVTFTAQQARGEISLGRTNIVEGSDVVRVNNQALVRDRDYRIDYDLGRITLIRQLGANDQLDIDYAYAPLFSQAGKTLIGSAFRWEGRDKTFGGAFLYESKGAQDLRPRIGEEPSRLMIGDLYTEWRFRPAFLTRLVDMLPGVRTTAASEFNVSAEVGGSLPNPNTKNEVYLDDMEGVRDAVSLSMSAERWRWASVPLRNDGGILQPIHISPLDRRANAETHWFTPITAVKERDLKPTLTNAEGAQNVHGSLAISLPKRPDSLATPNQDRLWAGLTYVLDPVGLDLSRSQFIEVWVNDFRDYWNTNQGVGAVRGRGVKLHIDIGVVNEDQQRAPDVLPNNSLDTEDRNADNQLSVNTDNEDTGVDQQLSGAETPQYDLVTASPADPHGDDFLRPNEGGTDYGDLDPRKWRYTNGSEDNHEVVPIPDTEDLNLNSRLDGTNNYFEYTIDLGEPDSVSRYFVDAAYAPGRVYTNDGDPVPPDNGWRRFRIPISDSLRATFGTPDLALARHVRVWIENMVETDPVAPILGLENDDGRPFLMLGGLEVVGSRWQLAALDSSIQEGGTTAALNALNTLDNADQYVPPFDPGSTRSGSQELARREQALVLEFENLQPGDSVETYKTFSIDEDYSRYGTLDWFITGFRIRGYVPTDDSLDYFVRFASDERGQHYYEYRARIPMSDTEGVNWQEVRLPLTNLSNLKLLPGFSQTGTYFQTAGANPGETYIINGRPSFTRLRRISFGVIHRGTRDYPSGQVWFNELRALDVARDPDLASRVQVAGRFANLMNYSVTYNGRGADFQQVGEARGRGSEQSSLNYTLSADLHRFFEATGIILPVSYTYNADKVVPRYTAGDDVFRSGAAADISTSRRITRSFSTSYARSWSDRSNPLLRYTIGGLTASYGRSVSEGVGPGGADTSTSHAATVNWLIAPRELLSLRLAPTRLRLYPLPERLFWNYRINTSDVHSYYRVQDGTGRLVPTTFSSGRAAFIDFGATTRPFDFLHHEFSATRNQTLPEHLREQIGFVNLGRVTGWRQGMGARVAVQKAPPWLRPTLTWSSNYRQDNGPELSQDLSVRAIANGQSVTMSMTLPFNMFAPRMAGSPPPMQRRVVMRPDTTGRDSARADTILVPAPRRPSFSLRKLVSRLGSIQTDARFVQGSGYSRMTGSPSFLYVVGVTQDPGSGDSTGGIRPSLGNTTSFQDEWGGSATANVDIGFGAIVRLRADLSGRRLEANRVTSRSDRILFPDLSVEYGRLPEVLLLSRLLRNPLVSTSYSRSQSTEYANRDDPTLIATSSDWKPLIRVQGDLPNGTRLDAKVERRVTQREDRLYINTVTTDRNTDLNLSFSRRYTSGQKVKVFGKESTVRTSVSWQLTGSYSKRSGEAETKDTGRIQGRTEADRLSVNATGSYGFSSNVTGNLDLGFLQDRNIETRITNRSVRIEARAQFTF